MQSFDIITLKRIDAIDRRLARKYYLTKSNQTLPGRLLFCVYQRYYQGDDDRQDHQYDGEQFIITHKLTLLSSDSRSGFYLIGESSLPVGSQPPTVMMASMTPLYQRAFTTVKWVDSFMRWQ